LKVVRLVGALVLAGAAVPVIAGPPYLTDDPVPTDLGHWEIYSFTAVEGHRSDVDDDLGLDLNYGAVKGVQLTATLPLSFSHERPNGWRGGSGDVELGVKYRLINDEKEGFSAAIFPRAILPTASRSSSEKTHILLPLWVGKDFRGGTSLFGGGGYELNPGPRNRNFWQASVAVTTCERQPRPLHWPYIRRRSAAPVKAQSVAGGCYRCADRRLVEVCLGHDHAQTQPGA
jgi:hypothetical protein